MSEALQAGLDTLNSVPATDDRTALILAKCRALLRGYDLRWSGSTYEPIEVEKIISADLTNPATGRKSRDLTTAGKMDVLAMHTSKLTVVDHKTTSDDITDPSGSYWRQLVVESQPSHYMLLKWLNGVAVDEAMWDVMRKPSISPKKLATKAERASVVANRRYFDTPLSDAAMTWLQANDRENLEMYEARLLHDCTVERPQYYFQRKTIPRLDSEIADYAAELWDAGQLILEARRKNRWPKHPGSCMNYGSPCKFLGICSGQDTTDSANWKIKEQVHAELSPEQSRNTLSYSSIRCYQTCTRKFYHTYELGIERIDEEERETLLFGHLWHLGLQVYWEALIPKENEHGNSSTSTGANSVPGNCDSETPLDF